MLVRVVVMKEIEIDENEHGSILEKVIDQVYEDPPDFFDKAIFTVMEIGDNQ